MATLRKEDRIRLAELRKQEAYNQNAAAASGGPGSPTFTAAGQVHPDKNPFDHKDTNKAGVAVQRGATVESGTSTVRPTKTVSL